MSGVESGDNESADALSFGTPILVLAFNRPDCLERLLARLEEVRPRELFAVVDGPRLTVPSDRDSVRQCVELLEGINWDCRVTLLARQENLGCGRGVSDAITWFFDQVPEGIILEDDIIPELDFFPFCAEMLEVYRDDPQVGAISGCNLVPRDVQGSRAGPYRFSQIVFVWGWASWRRSWYAYEYEIGDWRRKLSAWQLLWLCGFSIPQVIYWSRTFDKIARHEIDTWDLQLTFHMMRARRLSATANVNLVTNIGFGADATHTKAVVKMPGLGHMKFPIKKQPIELDRHADRWVGRHHFHSTFVPSVRRLASRMVGVFPSSSWPPRGGRFD